MITLQRRIFSLTAASPSSGAVIFCFAACISAIPYLHISIIHILPRHPFRRPIFSYIISPAASRPSYIFPYYYLPRRLLTVPYFRIIIFPAASRPSYISILLSSPRALGRPIFPYYYIPCRPCPRLADGYSFFLYSSCMAVPAPRCVAAVAFAGGKISPFRRCATHFGHDRWMYSACRETLCPAW